MRSPMARRKFSISTSVFFTSDEYTSEPTMGQKGTCTPPHPQVSAHTARSSRNHHGIEVPTEPKHPATFQIRLFINF